MKKILVTGATGFIGNYVVTELLDRGHHVVASSANKKKAEAFAWFNSVQYRELDLRNVSVTENYHNFFGHPELAIHLAWEGLPNYKSAFHFEDNLIRHYNFLKNLIVSGCPDITVTGTCFEYGMREGKLSEDMPSDPQNPYGLAKDTLRKFLAELRKTHPFIFKWVRLFYLFGKGQNSKSLFSQLDQALANGDKIFNMSGGEQLRDYLPVSEAAKYICDIAIQSASEGIINCCSGNPISVGELVRSYLANNKKSIELNFGFYPYPDYEPMAFWGDNKKLQSILDE